MWHWNSLWAPPGGDKPAPDDPARPSAPWTPEHAAALQSHAWESLMGASRAWWTFWLAALPLPQHPGQVDAPSEPAPGPANPMARRTRAASAAADDDGADAESDETDEAEEEVDAEADEFEEAEQAPAPAPRRARTPVAAKRAPRAAPARKR